jgi:hypothetical protein
MYFILYVKKKFYKNYLRTFSHHSTIKFKMESIVINNGGFNAFYERNSIPRISDKNET